MVTIESDSTESGGARPDMEVVLAGTAIATTVRFHPVEKWDGEDHDFVFGGPVETLPERLSEALLGRRP